MHKRSRVDTYEDESDNSKDYFDESLNSSILINLSRAIFSRQAKSLKIRREHLTPALPKNTRKTTLKESINILNESLQELLGLHLDQNGNEYYLHSCLEPKSKDILHELLSDDPQEIVSNTSQDIHSLIPAHKRHPVVVNTYENCMGGFQLLVIIILVLSQNRISETDLHEALYSFGFSSRLNITMPVFNQPVQNIVAEMVRREYLDRSKSKSTLGEYDVGYTLGKRALREFSPETLHTILEDIVSLEEHKSKISKSLRRCFPLYEVAEEQVNSTPE